MSKGNRQMLRSALLSGVGLHLLTTACTLGATLNVPGNFSTIQAAINGATNGDTIIVAPGTYNTKINFMGKQVTLRSSGGPNVTTINAAGQNGSVVTCASAETNFTVLEGFKLTGGTGNLIGGRFRGGGMACQGASPIVRRCIFTGNIADDGAGVYNFVGDGKFYNCLFYGNNAQNGGAFYNDLSNPITTNCTIARNTASSLGGGYFGTSGSSVRLINCIVWSNDGDSFGGPGSRIVTYSDVQGGVPGKGNLDINPVFINLNGNDFRLNSTSPCIDAGDSTAIATLVSKDLDNNPRGADAPTVPDTGIPVFGLVVEMGAYERVTQCAVNTCPADISGNGVVGIDDLLSLIAAWGVCP